MKEYIFDLIIKNDDFVSLNNDINEPDKEISIINELISKSLKDFNFKLILKRYEEIKN